MKKQYMPLYRDPGFATLPRGLEWDLVEAPLSISSRRQDLKTSTHRYGVFECRPLTAEECATFELKEV